MTSELAARPDTCALVARALAQDVTEILENDRAVCEAFTQRLAPLCRDLPGDADERLGELFHELMVRAYRSHGVDVHREATVVESLTVRLLSLVDWRAVGRHFRQP